MTINDKIIMYKLVTPQMSTNNNTKWEIGVANRAMEPGNDMCSNQVLHCYSDPLLAVLFNPIHASIINPVLLKIECSEIINTDGLKHACKEQTPISMEELPVVTTTQKIAFAIKCALLVYKATDFVMWANKWLSGEDRSPADAYAAAAAARDARDYAAGDYATYAADAYAAAARAAQAAGDYAAYAADAYAAAAAARAARAARAAAYVAGAAVAAAARAAQAVAYAAAAAVAYAAAAGKIIGETFKEIITWVVHNIK